MIKRIKLYGERNTGTNYLQHLIKLNLNINVMRGYTLRYVSLVSYALQQTFSSFVKRHRIDEWIKDVYFKFTTSKNLGWKHTMISPELMDIISNFRNNVLFLTLTKNPYSWLLSLYKNPYHFQRENLSFEQFLLKPWITVGRENSLKQFINPVEMWNLKNKSYMELNNNVPTLNIKYEDLLAHPGKVISDISDCLDIKNGRNNFKNVEKSTKEETKDFHFYQNYYLKKEWKKNLSKRAILIINTHLDEDILNYFNYNKIEK